MNDSSPLRTIITKYNKPKVQFFYQNTTTPPNINKENATNTNISPFKFVRNDSSHSIIKEDKRYSCFTCGRQATHKSSISSKHYCTFCSTAQMKKGLQLVEVPQKQIKTTKKPQIPKKRQEQSRETQLESFLQELENQQNKIKSLLQQSLKNEDFIKKNFILKREQTKIFYQKIQRAIKTSLAQDLQFLDSLQKQQLSFLIQPRQSLKHDISKLNGIMLDIKPNLKKIVEKVEEAKYIEFMENYKQQIKRIAHQSINIRNNLRKIGIVTPIGEKTNYLDPSFYRVFQSEDSTVIDSGDGHNGIFFSFEKKK